MFQGVPELIAIVSLAFAIAQIPFNWYRITIIGVALGFSAYLARLLPITFQIHTVLLIILLFGFLVLLEKTDLSLAFLSSLLSFLTLVVLEYMSVVILMPIFRLTPEIIATNTLIRILMGEPHVVLIFFFAYITNYVRKRGKTNEFLRKYQL
ncbi:hypothetical protein REC12_01950 [Desulfosporosinus sp. PR]|uniref:hypothetical protein n=1 Tax=Candidatus Desulfosporosinus nitrosoreducens TaxID=3401928 RepID=UPI0027F88455|nr:hypothetical protein [Desulfosporosinus sp. PR]MDQ7092355.1 hypothetical protein [Desulfosporosinus sp. PR]